MCEWRSIPKAEWSQEELAAIVARILTPKVTESLPQNWQGFYSLERAKGWVTERDAEGVNLLVIEKNTQTAMGFIILSGNDSFKDLRLGYLLAESSWGQGYASELIQGFVEWCRENAISSVTGGVAKGNIASRRVLEKSGFVCMSDSSDCEEQMLVLRIN